MRIRAGPVMRVWAGPDILIGRGPLCACLCMVCDILGNSLSFVLTVFRLCFRYFRTEREELGMIAKHKLPFSAFCDLL